MGPGTELHRLLSRFGLRPNGDCLCHQRMEVMNEMGCDWCDANVDTIVRWMVDEAKARKVPAAGTVMFRILAETMARWATRKAREKERLGDGC